MIVRKIEKEDLPVIAKLANDETFETMEDICFIHSRICLSDDGEVLCFIVVRERSLIEFFNGDIPADEERDEYYEEGDEWMIKEIIENNDNHYEVVAMYYNGDYIAYNHTIIAVEKGDCRYQDCILWSVKELPRLESFYNFNNIIWINFPIDD